MYPKTCPQNPHAYYTMEEEFPNPLTVVKGFSCKDKLIGMHSQNYTEINIVLGGSGVHYIKNRCIPANTGDVFFILPDYAHGYMGDHNFEVYNILIHKKLIAKYLIELQALPAFAILLQAEPLLRSSNTEPLFLTLNELQLQSIHYLLDEIEQHSSPADYSEALIANHLVIILIAKLCSCYLENVGDLNYRKKKNDMAFLNAISRIHEGYKENITVDELASIAHLSRSALVRRFHETCGMAPHKYLVKRRIEAATHFLENTDLTLAEIAENSGFYDTAHFTRVFQSETGISPSKYRSLNDV